MVAEHFVAIVFVVNENCPHVFAAQEKELLLNNNKNSTFGLDYFLNDCLFPTATQLRSGGRLRMHIQAKHDINL